MTDITINGIVISFPFKPYSVQEEYMSKVIECLQNSKHGVLESPTGTGKTLSLLCSSLAWLITKKAQLQAQAAVGAIEKPGSGSLFFKQLNDGLEKAAGTPDTAPNFGWAMPQIIYASRTHSQLSQAMQELKRTSYKHVATTVLGSRDQLCIHPEVSTETNTSNKIHMCHCKVKARTCFYYNNVESRKLDPIFKEQILDIEDLVKTGQKLKCCPYFLTRELKQNADIVFMPYNYLLDPKTRRSQGIDLQNNVILLDEAHNVEKTCEEAASLQISSTEIALCIDEITAVMREIANEANPENGVSIDDIMPSTPKDFTGEDLCILKAMFLELEKAVDAIQLKKVDEGETFPGGYIFELLAKAELTHGKEQMVVEKLDKIIQYLSSSSSSPFTRKGNALQKFNDLLRTVFSSGSSSVHRRERIKRCYKVYVQKEEEKKSYKGQSWETKKMTSKITGKLISYWCFSPGFGMQQLMDQGVRSIVLTSGTLSPLKPFISELGIPIDVQLENPHIIHNKQVCVGVLSQGPDSHQLNSSYNTRNDPRYIASLGRTILNFSCLIPDGLLVFFPSYPIMKKCRDDWQNTGLWTKMAERKPIYVEPQSKEGFVNVMHEYYQKIQDPSCKGAIFMAVCRGKVSEGLDFADANGRAVLITGLPFPPLKDPRVVLKQRYLEEMRVEDKEGLSGQQWYQLEASRAVNQAVGRIIRHKNDYGAIILCDCRFANPNFKKQMSNWLRPHIRMFAHFGSVTKDLREFFKYTEKALPQPKKQGVRHGSESLITAVPASFDQTVSRGRDDATKKLSSPSESQKDESFDITEYMLEADEKGMNIYVEEQKPKTFSELFAAKSKRCINFNTCKLKEPQHIRPLPTMDSAATPEPAAKKRKIKMLPVEFNSNISQPSTSAAIKNELPSVCNESKCTDKDDSKNVQTRELGKTYLMDVKRLLSRDNYQKFGKMIKNYTNIGNFDDLLQTLEELFPLKSDRQHLFIGFKNFIKKRDISSFEECIKRRNS